MRLASETIQEFRNDFGARVRECREAVGLSQHEVSRRMNASPCYACNIENGYASIRLDHVRALAKIIDANLEDLIP